jgi:pentatricopeptide repeat protein
MHVNVETKTALLKGYAHSGVMLKGAELFKSMCLSRGKCVTYFLCYVLAMLHQTYNFRSHAHDDQRYTKSSKCTDVEHVASRVSMDGDE